MPNWHPTSYHTYSISTYLPTSTGTSRHMRLAACAVSTLLRLCSSRVFRLHVVVFAEQPSGGIGEALCYIARIARLINDTNMGHMGTSACRNQTSTCHSCRLLHVPCRERRLCFAVHSRRYVYIPVSSDREEIQFQSRRKKKYTGLQHRQAHFHSAQFIP